MLQPFSFAIDRIFGPLAAILLCENGTRGGGGGAGTSPVPGALDAGRVPRTTAETHALDAHGLDLVSDCNCPSRHLPVRAKDALPLRILLPHGCFTASATCVAYPGF